MISNEETDDLGEKELIEGEEVLGKWEGIGWSHGKRVVLDSQSISSMGHSYASGTCGEMLTQHQLSSIEGLGRNERKPFLEVNNGSLPK